MSFVWTDDAVALVTTAWTRDGRTCGQIAKALHEAFGEPVTRNMVAGKIGRLALPKAPPVAKAGKPAGPARKHPGSRQKPAPAPVVGLRPARVTREAGGYRLLDLRPRECRFALTSHTARPEAHRFCGERTVSEKSSWCAAHESVVFTVNEFARRRAA